MSAIDHEFIDKLRKAQQINVFKYGDELVPILDARQKIASIILDSRNDKPEDLKQSFEWYNTQIKKRLGL